MICLADELHIAILDAVVHHFYKVTGAIFANPVATGSSVIHFCRDGLENFLHVRPRFYISARHYGRSEARAFFAAGNTGADEKNSLRCEILCAPSCVREK